MFVFLACSPGESPHGSAGGQSDSDASPDSAAVFFWALIEESRAGNEDCENQVTALHSLLVQRKADEIVMFFREFHERMRESYRRELWAALQQDSGLDECGDDCFESVRAWMIAQGRTFYEGALRYPQKFAAGSNIRECNAFLKVAFDAYHQKTGEYMRLEEGIEPYELQ